MLKLSSGVVIEPDRNVTIIQGHTPENETAFNNQGKQIYIWSQAVFTMYGSLMTYKTQELTWTGSTTNPGSTSAQAITSLPWPRTIEGAVMHDWSWCKIQYSSTDHSIETTILTYIQSTWCVTYGYENLHCYRQPIINKTEIKQVLHRVPCPLPSPLVDWKETRTGRVTPPTRCICQVSNWYLKTCKKKSGNFFAGWEL